tara:strand:- start:973 stop:1740 length:768 start_codon:yes stop_codon:yes gene_type:complete
MNSEETENKTVKNFCPVLTFNCISCRKQFKYLLSFQRHAIKPTRPNGCSNPNKLSWELCKKHAQKQIDYYKLPKKEKTGGVCMYNAALTMRDILKVKTSCNVSIKSIIAGLDGCSMGAISADNRTLFNLFINKYKNLGYELLTVEHVAPYSLNDDDVIDGLVSKHFYYLTKENIIYLLWRNSNGKLIKVGKKIDMNVNDYKVNCGMIQYEIKKCHLKTTFGFYGCDATYYSHTWDKYTFIPNRTPINSACNNVFK